MDRLKLERDRAAASSTAAVAAPPIHADSSALDQRGEKLITLRVEDSNELAEEGTELSFLAHEIGNDMGELVRRVCDKLRLGKGLGACAMHATVP